MSDHLYQPAYRDAMDWLEERLSEGPVDSTVLLSEWKSMSQMSGKPLRTAAIKLGVRISPKPNALTQRATVWELSE